eukprot:jgi/Mesen1/5592/ME000282S04743
MEDLREEVICHMFEVDGWDSALIGRLACTSRHFANVMRKSVWRSFCLSKGGKLLSQLSEESLELDKDWSELARFLVLCPSTQCYPEGFEKPPLHKLQFSYDKDGSTTFLRAKHKQDTLYLARTCDHVDNGGEIRVFKGIFKDFATSTVRNRLEGRESGCKRAVPFRKTERCPFCSSQVWPASSVVGQDEVSFLGGCVFEYEVNICTKGHLYGMWVPEGDFDDDEEGWDLEDPSDIEFDSDDAEFFSDNDFCCAFDGDFEVDWGSHLDLAEAEAEMALAFPEAEEDSAVVVSSNAGASVGAGELRCASAKSGGPDEEGGGGWFEEEIKELDAEMVEADENNQDAS